MTTIVLIIVPLIIILFLILLYFIIKSIYNHFNKEEDKDFNSDLSVVGYYFLTIAFLFLIFSFVSPFLFTRLSATKDFDFSNTGEIGDTLGGIMNPFIAICGVIVTGLAFYMQYNANRIQVKSFKKEFNNQISENKLQKFESQFYEMLRLHKENVNEIKLDTIFYLQKEGEFNTIKDSHDYIKTRIDRQVSGRECFKLFADELRICNEVVKKSNGVFDFGKAYDLFWKGINGFPIADQTYIKAIEVNSNHNEKFLFENNSPNTNFLDSIGLGNVIVNYELFNGHENELGHYYRHLFHTVKFVANQEEDFINYERKRDYLRLLRAQLSNYEQVMLFYNHIAYAKQWENSQNKFFSDYRMIHNLYDNLLMDDPYFHDKLKTLVDKQSVARFIMNKTDDYIFEFQGW